MKIQVILLLLFLLVAEPFAGVLFDSPSGVSSSLLARQHKKQSHKQLVAGKKSATAHRKSSAQSKSSKKGKKGKKSSKGKRGLPKPYLSDRSIDSTLAPGVVHRSVIAGNGKYSINIIEVNLRESEADVAVIKSRNRFNGVEKLIDLSARIDSTGPDTILAAINGNFWRAYTNTPIGPTVANGEVIELPSYKLWSSGFFDQKGRLTIDQFVLSGTVRDGGSQELAIGQVNHRSDSLGIVLYNTFSGDTIPYIKPIPEADILEEMKANPTFAEFDSTEAATTQAQIVQALAQKKRETQLEFPLRKVRVRYLQPPLVNRRTPCVVLSLDTGVVIVPTGGAVLSYGVDILGELLPRVGDTISILFQTNVSQSTPFVHAVCGTPRLVRNGKAVDEARQEGSSSHRFISGNLSRTAIGMDKRNSILYLVTVDGTNRGEGTRGITLLELANLMRDIGAYNAMNLDGGGSVTMVVGGKNVVRIGGVEFNRKVAVALAVVRRQPIVLKEGE